MVGRVCMEASSHNNIRRLEACKQSWYLFWVVLSVGINLNEGCVTLASGKEESGAHRAPYSNIER